MELMVDPVMVATGHTYDRPFIQRWLEQGHKTCPVTGVKLRHLELIPNFALRSAIQEWAAANGLTLNNRQLTSVMEKAVVNSVSGEDGAVMGASAVPHCVLEGHDEIVWAVEATAGLISSVPPRTRPSVCGTRRLEDACTCSRSIPVPCCLWR